MENISYIFLILGILAFIIFHIGVYFNSKIKNNIFTRELDLICLLIAVVLFFISSLMGNTTGFIIMIGALCLWLLLRD